VDIRDLVAALVDRDALRARQWVADAKRAGFDWATVKAPFGLDALGLAVAAALVELMAERNGAEPPSWTRTVPAAPQRVFLVRAAESLPRLRRLCEDEGPEPLRRRGLLAPPDFLTAA
jgi:hypothetical protein